MDSDQHPLRATPDPDDEAERDVADLVRGVAAGWTMPADRLGASTWRDRIDGARPAASRRPGPGWLRRTVLGASAAIVGTAALALVAVWLAVSRPALIGVGPGQSGAPRGPGPSAPGAVPTSNPVSFPPASAGPTPSPLPALQVYGPALTGRVVAGLGLGFESIDLATGRATTLLAGGSYGSRLIRMADGDLLCLCQTWASTDMISGTLSLDIRLLAADGTVSRTIPVRVLSATADPGTGTADSQGAVAAADVSADGRTAYVSWGYRVSPTWHFGIDVVDVEAGRVVQRVGLPDRPSIVGGSPIGPWLPWLHAAPDGSAAMVTIGGLDGAAGISHVLASLSGGRIVSTTTVPSTGVTIGGSSCGFWSSEGWATARSYFSVCSMPAGIVLIDTTGRVMATNLFGSATGGFIEPGTGGADAVDQRAGVLYHWDPYGRTLTRVDLATGRVTGSVTATSPTAAADGGWLAGLWDLGRAIERWIVPDATAKTFLQPGLALSPDGSRVYAIGVSGSGGGAASSSGVDIFDPRSMTQVGHWDPIADLVSIAVSPDGRFVYVAGAPGGGQGVPSTPSSLAVYDARTGTLRLVAGNLGSDYLALMP